MEFHLSHALIRKLCKLTTPVTIDEETAKICAENSEMFKHVSLAKDVFKTPEMTFKEVTDYKIKPMYINLFNVFSFLKNCGINNQFRKSTWENEILFSHLYYSIYNFNQQITQRYFYAKGGKECLIDLYNGWQWQF